MPIDFSVVPLHVKMAIAEKQDFFDFVNFSKTSRKSFAIAAQVRTRFTYDLDQETTLMRNEKGEFYLQYFAYNKPTLNGFIFERDIANSRVIFKKLNVIDFNEEACDWLEKVFSSTGSSIESLDLRGIQCSPEQLDRFTSTAKTTKMECWGGIPSEYLGIPAIKKLNSLSAWALSDADFLLLKMENINVGRTIISTFTVNTILKEWYRGERDIERIVLSLAPRSRLESIVEGLPHTPSGSKKSKFKRYYLKNENQISICIVFIKAESVLEIDRN